MNNASPGDIITVKPGTYTENLIVSKSNITIRSESGNPDNTIIKYKSAPANVLLLQGNNIKISGFKITGSSRSPYAGINLSSCSNCIIENNKLLNNARGIYLLKSNGITVSKNSAASSVEYGIALQGSTGNTISENTASDNQRGVYFGTSDDNVLSSNTVQNNSVFGIFLCGLSDRNSVYNNYFNNTIMTIRNGIGNSYSTTKTAGANIVGGPYIGGNFWGKPDGTGFSQTAVDNDGDGISDSAYKNIEGSTNSDNLPLVITSIPPDPQLPVVDFSSNVTSGNAPLNIAFTDTSTGSPTAWNWSFGDGTANSTVQNPTHNYSAAGSYTVTLTVSNSTGSNTKTKTNYITVTAPITPIPPVASFSSNVTSGNAPLNIAFTDTSTGSPTAWNWSFGDGTANSTVQNPTHTYSTAGNYTVMLTASNSTGSNTTTKPNYVTVTAPTTPILPVASFSSNVTSGNAPLNVAFTDTSTGTPTAWNWSFGDGTANSTVKNPTHTYSAAGNYTVTLTVINSTGSNTTIKPDYIKVITPTPIPPVASFSSNVTSGTAPLNVAFTDTSTRTPTAWNWSFGDGTANSTVKNPTHTYSAAGNYTVTLTATNAAGSNTATNSNYIKATTPTTLKPPVVSFWASRTSGKAPLTLGFTDASTGSPTSWKWSFGDGTYSTLKNPRHTYAKAGTYTITLTASNAAGSGTKTRTNYIKITK